MSEHITTMNDKDLIDSCERGLKVGYWDKGLIPELRKRLEQQQKKDKLLGLYRERKDLQNYRGEHPEEYYDIDEQINQLEEELK